MDKRHNKMGDSKNAEKRDVENDKPSKKSISVLKKEEDNAEIITDINLRPYKPLKKSISVLKKEEDNAEIITGINLRPSFRFNEFPNRLGNVTNNVEKAFNSHTTYAYHKGCNVNNNLKTPIIIEDNSNSNKSSQDLKIDSVSEMNISRPESEVSSICALLEMKLNDESDSENVENDVLLAPELGNIQKQNLIVPQFYCLRNKVLAIMKPESTFWFCGKLKVQVLYGSIQIYGAVLNSSTTVIPVEVFSPRNQSFVGIGTENGPSECNEEKLWETLASEGINRKIKSCLVLNIKQFQPGGAVILLENLTNHMTEFISTFCSFKLFPKIDDQTFYSWTDPKRAEVTLQANFRYSKAGNQLTFNPQWKTEVVDKILDEYSRKQKSINLIFGGKNVGKSTFSRYLVNNILPKSGTVVLINLDPGQTECTPSGCISLNLIDKPLLGPNFTQLRTPYYQLYIGEVNVVNCVTRYLEGVYKMANILSSDSRISNFPVIVNTMGFCKGIGWDIAVSLTQIFQPTNVIQIMSKKPKNNFDHCLSRNIVQRQKFSWITWDKCEKERRELSYDLVQINTEAEELHSNGETWNMEPYQKRDLVMLTYLSQITENSTSIRSYNATLSINDVVPYMVPLSSLYLSLTQTGVPVTHVLAAMNGNIVALCGFDPSDVSANVNSHSSDKKPQVLVRPPLSTCYGFGIIRGVEIEKGIVYLNTPLTSEVMQFVNCLVDCVRIPSSLLTLNLPNAPYTGNKADLPTSKEPRRGYFKMRNQTAF